MYLLPGLCPDWDTWDPKNAKENAKEAMDAAEQWLDVPQVGILKNIDVYQRRGSSFSECFWCQCFESELNRNVYRKP